MLLGAILIYYKPDTSYVLPSALQLPGPLQLQSCG
jgi:hypothetical protein